MKDISSFEKTKDVIAGRHISKESIYYTVLFGIALIVSVALMIVACAQDNKGLKIYAAVLIPLFVLATSVSARFTCISKNKIYIKNGSIVIKSFFVTRKFNISEIKKLTSAQFGKEGLTSIKLKYREKTFKYTFKSLTKEDVAKIRHTLSKN